MQLGQSLQTRGEDRLVRAIAGVGAVQQRHVPHLADQHPQPHHPQVAALALGVSAPRQLPGRRRRNGGVEVGGVEGEHLRRKLEARHRRARDGQLRAFQLLRGDAGRAAMKRLPGEALDRQAGNPRHTGIEERSQIALGAGRTRALQRHPERQLPHRGPLRRSGRAARLVDQPHDIKLLGHPAERTGIAHALDAHRARLGEVGDRRRVRRAEQHLARHGLLLAGIPHRLSHDAIQAAVHEAFEKVYSFN